MKEDTRLTHSGRHPEKHKGAVNTPVYRASTIIFPSYAELEEDRTKGPNKKSDWLSYGRSGTPTTHDLEAAVCELEGGAACRLAPSGKAAINSTLLSFLDSGDHLLVTDSVYGPTRDFCDHFLTRYNIETTYYDPLVGGGIADLIQANTKVVFVESPGSVTFEVQDLPGIVAAAHEKGAIVMVDNTWATSVFHKPLAYGADISILAATKYLAGHADVMLGTVTANAATAHRMTSGHQRQGLCVSSDEAYLALRGMRTLGVRLRQHEKTGLVLARWLAVRPEVERMLHPALPDCPGHDIWSRDFSGACGLFGFVLNPCAHKQVVALMDGLNYFGMGYSWGAFESLILDYDPSLKMRSATEWQASGPTLRIHAGLEDVDDLLADLEQGFAKFNQAG